MKRNAIARIVIYSILAVVLTGVLLVGILANGYSIDFSSSGGTTVESETSIDVDGIKKLDIEWACGAVTIQVADTDQITFTETAPENCKYQMTYDVNGSTLELNYSQRFSIGFGNNSFYGHSFIDNNGRNILLCSNFTILIFFCAIQNIFNVFRVN
jgi:hypothetical protein